MRSRWGGWVFIAVAWVALIVMGYHFISFMRQSREPQHPFRGYIDSDNPKIWKELKPNYKQIYDGLMVRIPPTVIQTNSHGFRDVERSLGKPLGTFRVVVLGDSMAFGFGVEQDEPFPAVLEGLLNEQGNGIQYEVLNLAIPGYNTMEEVELFRETGRQYEPDLVILQFMDNDWDNQTRRKEIFNNRNTAVELEKAVHKQFSEEQASMTFDEKWASVEVPLRELYSILNRTPLIIVPFSFDNPQAVALDELAGEFNWTVLHIRSIYGYGPDDEEYQEMIVHPQDVHPSAKAHRLVAETLMREVIGIEESIWHP